MKTAGVFHYAIFQPEIVWKSPCHFRPTGIFWINFASSWRSVGWNAAWKIARENIKKRGERKRFFFSTYFSRAGRARINSRVRPLILVAPVRPKFALSSGSLPYSLHLFREFGKGIKMVLGYWHNGNEAPRM